MSKALVVAEHDSGMLHSGVARVVSCGLALEPEALDVAILGEECAAIAQQAAGIAGVTRVLCLERTENAKPLAAVQAPQLAALASSGYSHVLGPSTTFGKDLMPRVAALLGVPQVSDIMSVEGAHRFKRPIYAGNAVLTVEAPAEHVVVGTARLASWQAASEGGEAAIEQVTLDVELPAHTKWLELRATESERPDLQSANVVVSGGRALGSGENFSLLYELADSLGAAVGASRAAVDAGYVPNDMQVGQTGKIIAPELYFAIGISGAIQHLTGIKDAGVIVAINKDPEAPIFEIADIGLVGDLFALVPELKTALEAS
ncbi:electron transfer flavoprotein subunit alpha/FixB family protein [Candidatus Foliamicus sp.]